MPEFKLKKLFSRSRLSSRQRHNSSNDDKNKDGCIPERIPGESPELHGRSLSAGYGSKSLLPGNGIDRNSSKYSSLPRERYCRTGSDGGISGMSEYEEHSDNPLNFPMEHFQSFNATYGSRQRTHLGNSSIPRRLTRPETPNISFSPNHLARSSPIHSNHHISNLNSVSTNELHDRSCDNFKNDHIYANEYSRERHMNHVQLPFDPSHRIPRPNYRDRSSDKDYPHMGARSLDREASYATSRSHYDRDDPISHLYGSSRFLPQDYGNNLIFDLQYQITDLHQECAKLQNEVDLAQNNLTSNMNSIKTFWSPELKKERAVRKEEVTKCTILNEQLKVAHAELKKNRELVKKLSESFKTSGVEAVASATASEFVTLNLERDSLNKELLILKHTVNELEGLIETQRQTLSARDVSIKTLLSMLQERDLPTNLHEDEHCLLDNLQVEATRNAAKICELEASVDARDSDILVLNKDDRIACLEREVWSLEDKLCRSAEDASHGRDSAQRDGLSLKCKQLRVELDNMREQLMSKQREHSSLRLQEETVTRQYEETVQHVTLLKDQLAAKDSHIAMLQADIEGLQERVKSKEGTIERKSRESQNALSDRRRLELEMADLRDLLDSKERKITSLNVDVGRRDATVKEKSDHLADVEARLACAHAAGHAMSCLEDSVSEKDRQIGRLREAREQSDRDHVEEVDMYRKTNDNLKAQVEAVHSDLSVRQTELCDLREETAELRALEFRAKARIRQMEVSGGQSGKQCSSREVQTDSNPGTVISLCSDVPNGDEVTSHLDVVDELKRKVRDLEEEKSCQESQMAEMQEVIREYRQKMGTLKRSQQTEKKRSAQLLEEARKREGSFSDDASHLSTTIGWKNERIDELEEAVRQSVRITAQREVDMSDLKAEIDRSRLEVESMKKEVEAVRSLELDYQDRLATLTWKLEEREGHLRRLASERQRHMEDVFEMKQDAVQAAISEKDATIALLEMSSTKKQRHLEEIERLTHEKHRLQANLKEVSQNLMKLRHGGSCERGKVNADVVGNSGDVSMTVSVNGVQESDADIAGDGRKRGVAHRLRNAPPDQVVRVIRKLEHGKKRLTTLVDKLQTVCRDTDPAMLLGFASPAKGRAVDFANLRSLSFEQMLSEALSSEADYRSLQGQANFLLQHLGTRAPELLQAFLAILDSSDTDSCTSCQSN